MIDKEEEKETEGDRRREMQELRALALRQSVLHSFALAPIVLQQFRAVEKDWSNISLTPALL
jgi:hypothetical protein